MQNATGGVHGRCALRHIRRTWAKIKVKNNAANAIPEVDPVCREAKTDFLLKWSAENMPNTIVKMRKSVQSKKKEDRQEKGIVRCTANEIIFFFSCDGSWRGEVINAGDVVKTGAQNALTRVTGGWVDRMQVRSLVPRIRLDIGQQAGLARGVTLSKRLVVHMVKRNIALLL